MKKVSLTKDTLVAILAMAGVSFLLAGLAELFITKFQGEKTVVIRHGEPANTEPARDIVSVCEETAAGIEFFLALEKRPSASWTRWVVIDGHCYVSNWDEVWTCDEAEKMLAELQAKHLGAK